MAIVRYCIISSTTGVCDQVINWDNAYTYYPRSGFVVAGNNTGEVGWTYSGGTSAGGSWSYTEPLSSLSVGDPIAPLAVADGGTGTTTSTGSGSVVLSQSPTLTGSPAITTGTITSSAPLTFTQTWNSAGTTFTGYQVNVTDTASAAASLLMDLQTGGTSQFSVSKSGAIVTGSTASTGSISFGAAGQSGMYRNGNNTIIRGSGTDILNVTGSGMQVRSDQGLYWASTTSVTSGADLRLQRRGPANLQLGAADAAAPVAQSLSVQSVVAGTTNTAGTDFTINGSQGTGTGAGGSVIIRTAPAGTTGTAQNSLAERVRVGPAGQIGLGGANYGTSGQVLTSNGASAAPTWQNVAGVGFTVLDTQTFNANGTWTKPASGTYAIVRCWGGGGSGRKSTGSSSNNAGGGGGGFHEQIFALSDLTSTVSVTIGAGGTAVTAAGTNGNPGGNTSFGSYLTSYGGGGGGGNAGGGGGSGSAGVAGTPGTAAASVTANVLAQTIDLGALGTISNVGGWISVTANIKNGAGNDGLYGGGNGGNATNPVNGANSTWGGAGGGGTNSTTATPGGTSANGGAGGAGGVATNGTNGSAPGGGGGATFTGTQSGAGAAGRCVVYVI